MIGDRWGVSDEEVARPYPCDDLVSTPTLQAWRGVTVHASRSTVWRWVVQIRLAPYSYDWIDNLGRRSPQELRNLPDPVPGQHFTTGRVRSSNAGRPYLAAADEDENGAGRRAARGLLERG